MIKPLSFKEFVGKQLLHKRLHVTCDCIIALDVTGICVDYEIKSNELVFYIQDGSRRVPIGENTPNLKIETVS